MGLIQNRIRNLKKYLYNNFSRYDIRPNLVIGFHGCLKSIAIKLIANQAIIKKSEKPYDWLGHGMYFWENNLEREKLPLRPFISIKMSKRNPLFK
jgi:hypothetical protein